MSALTYSDDRYGCMRIHIAHQRATAACERYARDHLRAVAKAKLPDQRLGGLRKWHMAWHMAQYGLIDAEGYLRDGFPS